MSEDKSGWALLHSKLPSIALKPLPKAAYGIEGLTDVNEAYLIQRLFASELQWEWKITSQSYLGHEDRKGRDSDYTIRWYLASVSGELVIDGRSFAGSGAHDNKKLDAAYKGAATVAFKNACKLAGLTIELFKDGKAMDFIYEQDAPKNAPVHEAKSEAGTAPLSPLTSTANSGEPQSPASPAPPPWKESVEKAKAAVKPPQQQGYALEDAVCPSCGKKEALGPKGQFCAKAKGGCGWPTGRGEKGVPISYGMWLERNANKQESFA